MANTYSHCYNHIVFSTKNRVDLITPDIEDRVWAYIGGILRKHNMTALQVGGIDNHIHALTSSRPSVAPSQIAQYIKGGSSSWIHQEFQHLNNFAWQDGYGVFSVCKSHASKVIEYIKNQRKHHEKQTFEEEYIELLTLHEIEYDERYLFGWFNRRYATEIIGNDRYRGLKHHGYNRTVALRRRKDLGFHRVAVDWM